MLNILPAFQYQVNTFSVDILWSASCQLTSGKNNKALIDVINKIFLEIFPFINVEVHPLFSLFFYSSSYFSSFFAIKSEVFNNGTDAVFKMLNIIIK